VTLAEPLLDRDKPLWKVILVEGATDRTVLLSLGHHAMVDGASGVDISLVLFDLQREGAQYPAAEGPWQPAPMPGGGELLSEALSEGIGRMAPTSFLPPVAAPRHQPLFARAASVMQRMLTLPAMTAPWNAGLVGPKRRLIHTRYDMGAFRDIRRPFGGTINDVVLAVVSEAAARYLESHDEPIANQFLRIMCPVNVRREDEAGALGNRVSAIFPRLSAEPMEIVARLRYVQGETTLIKSNQEAQALELVSESGPRLPPVLMLPTLLVGTPFDPTALAARLPAPVAPKTGYRPPLIGFNFTCTNVPGVQTAQYIAGHEILDMYGLLMLSGNLGFGIVVCSYNRRLYLNLTCDPRLMPVPERMLGRLDDAVEELHAAAIAANTAAAANQG
jgi:WS/DGAT/MGAT family acyltransferase